MSPEVEKQIADILELSKKAGVQAADFLAQQAPELVEQILKWNIIINGFWVIFSLSILIILGCTFKKIWNSLDCDEKGIIVFPIVGIALFFMIFVGSGLKVLKTIYAPKLVILEKIQGITK